MRQIPGLILYTLFVGLILWAIFFSPHPLRDSPRSRPRGWVALALFLGIGLTLAGGIVYEVAVKKAPAPCPCGVPGCPPEPACEATHTKWVPDDPTP
jgi:hypothetical protein